ncbi:MAG: MFS transporter [Pseudonocardia sp.]
MLVTTMMIMGVSTLAIGLLPTYDSIGVAAPILLLILRLVQGFSLGGEWGGIATMLMEHAPRDRRAQVGSWAQVGGVFGPMLGTLAVTVVTMSMSHEQLLADPLPVQRRAHRDLDVRAPEGGGEPFLHRPEGVGQRREDADP